MKNTTIELRKAFGERICSEFKRMGLPLDSPTEIARVINRKLPQLSVTPQAVRKWIFGEGFPSQDKLVMLADWLGVSAQWLRYGTGERLPVPYHPDNSLGNEAASPSMMLFGYEYVRLIPLVDNLAKLSAKDLRVVEGVVAVLLSEG
jgi:transcriptional regulator with XRE-family HTH domain